MLNDLAIWKELAVQNTSQSVCTILRREARLEFVELYVSNKCQLNCKHCMPAGADTVEDELTQAEWIDVIDQLLEMGVRRFHIAGREPFIDGRSLEILGHLNKRRDTHAGLHYGAITNGLAIGKYIEQIKSSGVDYLDFSLDGTHDEHEFIRGPNTFSATLAGLRSAIDHLGRKKVYVSSVAFRHNIASIPDMVFDLSTLGVNKFFIQPLIPLGVGKLIDYLVPSPAEYNNLIESCLDRLKLSPKRLGVIFYAGGEHLRHLLDHNSTSRRALDEIKNGREPLIGVGNSVVKFRFGFVPWDYWRNSVVTPDGFYVGSCQMRSTRDFASRSVGNVKREPIDILFERSLASEHLWPQVFGQLMPTPLPDAPFAA